jgi:hypothetical protein
LVRQQLLQGPPRRTATAVVLIVLVHHGVQAT